MACKKNITGSYDAFKKFEGKRYISMKLGRAHRRSGNTWKITELEIQGLDAAMGKQITECYAKEAA